jgi:hypothetical protein
MKRFLTIFVVLALALSSSFADVEVDKYPTKPVPPKGNYFLHTGFVNVLPYHYKNYVKREYGNVYVCCLLAQ